MKAIPRRCRSGPFFPQALVGGLLPAGAGLTAGGRIKGRWRQNQRQRFDRSIDEISTPDQHGLLAGLTLRSSVRPEV